MDRIAYSKRARTSYINQQKLGYIGNYRNLSLYSDYVIDDDYGEEQTIYVLDSRLQNKRGHFKSIMVLNLSAASPAWFVGSVKIDSKYQGFGLAPKIYRYLLKKGIILKSGDCQSPGGRYIWYELSKMPDVLVTYQGKRFMRVAIPNDDLREITTPDNKDVYDGNHNRSAYAQYVKA